jgi:hypothetical protein
MIKRIIKFLDRITPKNPTKEGLVSYLYEEESVEIPFKGGHLNDLRAKARPLKKVIKIALDESVGTALGAKIAAKGYQVVCRAGHAETDESWMKRALANGAVFIVSPDLDIPSMIERENLPMVWIDYLFASHINPTLSSSMSKEQKHRIWVQYIHDRIQSKLRFLSKEFGDQ